MNKLKKQLGSQYIFEKHMTEKEICEVHNRNPSQFSERLICALTAGCVKIEAVIYKVKGGLALGYDVFVKDNPDSDEWICYDSPPDPVCIKDDAMELKMVSVLDRIVESCDLSYTKCNFEIVAGKPRKKTKPDETDNPAGTASTV